MTQFAYIAALITSIGCFALIDYRYKLAFWHNKKHAAKTILIAYGIFLVWDLLGIAFDIFMHGGSRFAMPYLLLPELPIEELFFIAMLCYSTLIIYTGLKKWQTT